VHAGFKLKLTVDLPEPKSFLKLITIDAPADTLTDDEIRRYSFIPVLYSKTWP
jgi:hypothetical protein